jgi:hypothetical protein
MTRSEITIKDVSWDNLGVIPSTFRKIGITLERRVMIFISRRMDGYEIKTDIDGSILTIEMRLGQDLRLIYEYRFSGGNTSKRRCFDTSKNV